MVDLESAITLGATVVLVIVTGYYALQNKRMADEMESNRRYQFRPALKIERTYLSLGSQLDVKISNIGLGPAKNIRGKCTLLPSGKIFEFFQPVLYPKQTVSFHEPFKSSIDGQIKIVLDATCEDLIGSPVQGMNDELQLVIGDNFTQAFPDFRNNSEIADIKRSLGDIAHGLKSIKDSMDGAAHSISSFRDAFR